MQRVLDEIERAKGAFRELLQGVAARGGMTEELYVRYLSFQHHLTKGVQRHFLKCAAHPCMSGKMKLRQFLFFLNPRTLSRDAFRAALAERLHQPLAAGVPLFAGLDDDQTRRFLRAVAVHRFVERESIFRKGDVGREIYVVLSGMVEVLVDRGGRRYSLQKLGPGELLGEIAVFGKTRRTADVIAVTDCELLVLTEQTFNKALGGIPDVAARVLMNLLSCVCSRLERATQTLAAEGSQS